MQEMFDRIFIQFFGINALLNLFHQRMMEWEAIKAIMASENIEVDWDYPTDLELAELAAACGYDDDEDDDEDLQPFWIISSSWIRRFR